MSSRRRLLCFLMFHLQWGHWSKWPLFSSPPPEIQGYTCSWLRHVTPVHWFSTSPLGDSRSSRWPPDDTYTFISEWLICSFNNDFFSTKYVLCFVPRNRDSGINKKLLFCSRRQTCQFSHEKCLTWGKPLKMIYKILHISSVFWRVCGFHHILKGVHDSISFKESLFCVILE